MTIAGHKGSLVHEIKVSWTSIKYCQPLPVKALDVKKATPATVMKNPVISDMYALPNMSIRMLNPKTV